ncbi:7621_t:CDS:2 [Ambispora gerdemannii]|uniref:7621_t:CDS:1 n=1 Tax=Ambispora gerdemannii TaxID=144530 RepID=A0A9N8YNY3_9GLOM|nr:7621_t:CDS:2 [Ambispora gerdemannii]
MSAGITRIIKNFFKVGPVSYWRQLQHIGDTKAGTLVGVDQFGNKYYENKEEIYGRDRWVEYGGTLYKDAYEDASMIPSEWHRWIHKLTEYPPTVEPAANPTFKATHKPNFTGTDKAYKPYNTTAPKYHSWEPKNITRKLTRNLNKLLTRVAPISNRNFTTTCLCAHENPLGIPLSPGQPSPAFLEKMRKGLPTKQRIEGIKHVIAIASGKGGVGKSTVAVNLALAVASLWRKRVGILDADIFGPSIPRLMNLNGEPNMTNKGQLIPLTNYGVKCMSIGFLVSQNSPVVWRGLMVMKALQQLIHQVFWDELDLLVIDMPPGTGDVQLTITQQILGIVQNMSVFICPTCQQKTHIFGTDGVLKVAKEMDLEMLGDIPLHTEICELSDRGQPIVIAKPESIQAQYYKDIAGKVSSKLDNPPHD